MSGPMTGKPDFNRAAFDHAAKTLRDDKLLVATIRPFLPAEVRNEGYEIVTPVSEDIRVYGSWEKAIERPWKEHLARDLATVPTCDAVILIDDWEVSRGANLEVRVAFTFDIPVFRLVQETASSRPRILLMMHDDYFGTHHAGDVPAPPPEEQTIASRESTFTLTGTPMPDGTTSIYDPTGRFVPYSENPARHEFETGGIKDNRGKAPINLLPSEPLVEVAKVLAFGAVKYKPHNWMLGLPWPDTYDSLQRHLLAWNAGEDDDPETGLSHLAHAGCQLLFLLWYVLIGKGKESDNRFRRPEPEKGKVETSTEPKYWGTD